MDKKNTSPGFSSNSLRLSGGEWTVVLILFAASLALGPLLWSRIETFAPEPNYRLPYELGSDYWLYSRHCDRACDQDRILVIGDSVIWGHYVRPESTLSGCLNEKAGGEQYANLGVDGIHPAALAGLLKYYGHAISRKDVILHLNPLWMCSSKVDLQDSKEFRFNHPKLVPQFTPRIPCYRASFSDKASIIAERYSTFLSWVSHLRIAYFQSMDLPTWTLEHPYENPLAAFTLELPEAETFDEKEHVSWTQKGLRRQDHEWVRLETSLQWRFFRASAETLRSRNNNVFVLVGPFNEHMLTESSVEKYHEMKLGIESWLRQNGVAHLIPPPLPSELYRDASHPLSEGYAILAQQLLESESFKAFME